MPKGNDSPYEEGTRREASGSRPTIPPGAGDWRSPSDRSSNSSRPVDSSASGSALRRQSQVIQWQEEREQDEQRECTFRPCIGEVSKSIMEKRRSATGSVVVAETASSTARRSRSEAGPVTQITRSTGSVFEPRPRKTSAAAEDAPAQRASTPRRSAGGQRV